MATLAPDLVQAIKSEVPKINPSMKDKHCNLGDVIGDIDDFPGRCFTVGAPAGNLWAILYAVGGIGVQAISLFSAKMGTAGRR